MEQRDREHFITVEDVTKSYTLGETRVAALRGVSLGLRRGEFSAIVGPSGSGKSTLLNIIGGLDEPDGGRVCLGAADLFALSDRQRTRLRNETISFVFQSFNLIPVLDVYENVELPLVINRRIAARDRALK